MVPEEGGGAAWRKAWRQARRGRNRAARRDGERRGMEVLVRSGAGNSKRESAGGVHSWIELGFGFAQARRMNSRAIGLVLLVVGSVLAGCGPQPATPAGGGGSAKDGAAGGGVGAGVNQGQPRLRSMKIYLGPKELDAELALTDEQRMAGMMYRTNMGEGEGMLFVFPVPHRTGFWMKNVTVPLSAAYIDPEGMILEIHDLQPGNTNPVEAASSRIQYVLETAQGWFLRNGVSTGAVIRTDRGSLAETFTWRR